MPNAPQPGARLRSRFIVAGLVLLTLFAYLQVSRHEFVDYDDEDYVTKNAHVQEGITWKSVRWSFTSGHASNWHPLTWISHMFDYQLFGGKPGGHHMINVMFHLVNTVLLFFLLWRLSGAMWRSAFVAALFAVHPLHVESVAWVSERKDVLSTLFFFLTLMAYGRYADRRKTGPHPAAGPASPTERSSRACANKKRADATVPPEPRRATTDKWSARCYFLALASFTLGLMSKPMLVTLPLVLLLLDFWPLQRIDFRNQWPQTIGRLVVEKIPFFVLALLSSIITYLVQQEGGAVSTTISLAARAENALVSYARYLKKTFWPDNLAVLYLHPGDWPNWQVVGSALLLAILTAMALKQWRKRPYLTVGWFWFLGTMVPVIGLVQVGIQSMADRYTYIPLIGVFICLTWMAAELVPNGPNRAKILGSGAALVLMAFTLLTRQQVAYWKNTGTLFTRAVQVDHRNYLAYNNLGFYLSKLGRAAEAMTNYARSLEINPFYEEALNNMGYALAGQKRHAEAIPYYERALKVRPNLVEAHNNLGNALSELGLLDDAITHYTFVLAKKPDHADAHNNLGIALAMKGRLDEAVGHFEKAIQFKKNYAGAHSNLGNAYAVQRKLNEAIAQYEICLRLNSRDAQAHNNLGNALAELGRLDEAIGHYREALRLNADNPEAHFNLGFALRKKGNTQEAAQHYREALRLKPTYAQAREQLAELEAAR